MSQPLDPIPQYDPLIDSAKHMNDRWYRWLSEVIERMLQASTVIGSVHRAAQTGSIATSTLITPVQPGVYRVSWSLQVTTAATVSSSIAVTVGWTAGGVAQTEAFAALTANTTGTHGSGSVTIYPTTAQAISYSTTYASVGGTPMAYGVDVVVEELT